MRREIARVAVALVAAAVAVAPGVAANDGGADGSVFGAESAASQSQAPDVDGASAIPINILGLRAPYLDDSLTNKHWDFGGDAIMEVNKYIRLTPDSQSQSGWIWARLPMTSNSWVVEFEFKVSHEGSLSGDGFAFWYTKDRAEEGPVFGNKDKFEGLGVFFDTYPNSKIRHAFPYVMGMIGDGKIPYDHDFDGNAAEAGGCHVEFRNREHMTRARVRYVHNNYVSVEMDVDGDNKWHPCFKVSSVSLPLMGYVGFTGLTGGVSSSHDIIAITTDGLLHAPEKDTKNPVPDPHGQTTDRSKVVNNPASKQTPNESSHHSSSGSSGFSTFFMVFVFLVLLAVGYAGWTIYRTSKTNSYKRF